jgi:hypothetical protein
MFVERTFNHFPWNQGGTMQRKMTAGMALLLMMAIAGAFVRSAPAQEETAAPDRLAVLWTSGDPDVAHRVAFMYAHNAKKAGWFDEVTLIVWGPSQRLLVGDKDLQKKIKEMQADGVVVEACVACAMSFGIVEELKAIGITVKPMGLPLTNYLKSGWKVLTF